MSSEWQHISAAPKDGTLIDIFITELDERYPDSSYDLERGCFYCDYPEIGKRLFFSATPPDYWMPISKPSKLTPSEASE